MRNNLAIVIPAYKIDFFRETLDSLAAQTCKDFTVYIGDDCSPADFRALVDEYSSRLDIVYKRFDTNLGGKDLVAQWTRCIEMTKGEPWIWLFSDDDMMGEKCVEKFYAEIKDNSSFGIYHYNIKVIDEEGCVIKVPRSYPEIISSKHFYKAKGNGKLECFVVEYVFSRDVYEKVNGFESFELAWGSDVATWVKMGFRNGIKTINGDYVLWRSSQKNITPKKDHDMSLKKLHINVDYIAWSQEFFKNDKEIRFYNLIFFMRRLRFYSKHIGRTDIKNTLLYAKSKNAFSSLSISFLTAIYPLLKFINK